MKNLLLIPLAVLTLCGCASSYSWRPGVPSGKRTIAVPTFRNETDLTEFGSVATRQVLREIQREGTFGILPGDDAALEVQGVVRSVSLGTLAYNRRLALRNSAHEFTAQVSVSVIDRETGRVLVNDRPYVARTTLSTGQDFDTSERDASGRLAEDLARRIVDDLLKLQW